MLAAWGMFHKVSAGGAGNESLIRSIQQVSITIASAQSSATATITAVSAANTLLIWNGIGGTDTTQNRGINFCSGILTNPTTITIQKPVATNPAVTVNLTVLEFKASAIANIQTGNIVIATAAATASATITSVVQANTLSHFNGSTYTTTTNANQTFSIFASLQLTSPTTVDCARGSLDGGSQLTTYYSIVQFRPDVLNQSTQQINVTTSGATALSTITSAALSNTILFYNHFYSSAGVNIQTYGPYIKIDNATQVQSFGEATLGQTRISGTVVNFKPTNVKSSNRGLLVMTTAAASAAVAITSAVQANTFASFVGCTFIASAASTVMTALPRIDLQSPTTVRAEMNRRITASPKETISIVSYQTLEFY